MSSTRIIANASRISLSCVLYLALGLMAAAQARAPATSAGIPVTALVPQPQSLALATAEAPFALGHAVRVVAPAALSQPARLLATTLDLGMLETDAPKSAREIRFVLESMAGAVAGAYRLQVRESAITIRAADAAGAFNGAQTLLQLLPPGEAARRTASRPAIAIPALDIADAPRFAWRGLTLDVARHFFGVPTIKRVIDSMAAYKLNVLHLHLTDDTGWRIAIRAYPKLTTIGARGDLSNPNGPARFYTAEDIRSIVRYAAERQIEVVPEIEMPGHGGAAARAYPEFFDGGNTWNPANPGTYRFIDAVLAEVTQLFPGRHIHFGGDEVSADNTGWVRMPDVVAMARELDPSSEKPNFKPVEAEFARRVVQLIRKHNRVPMGWDEIISAGLNADTLVQWWRMDKPDVMRTALNQGQSVVLSPADRMYLDYPAGLGEPGAPWEAIPAGRCRWKKSRRGSRCPPTWTLNKRRVSSALKRRCGLNWYAANRISNSCFIRAWRPWPKWPGACSLTPRPQPLPNAWCRTWRAGGRSAAACAVGGTMRSST
jgi:hexosaminidase